MNMKTATNLEIPYRNLGRTGERVSVIGLGGFHLSKPNNENEAIQIVRTAIDNGINFMDNSWDYAEGKSEIRMGKALREGYRNKVFLMTKIDGHDSKTATKQLDESLKRLQTDVIDLLQIHEVIRMTDPEIIFSAGGSMEALLAAKKAGKILYIGFTGHKSPDIHLKMLQTARDNGFKFDTLQMPLNLLDAHFNSFEKKVLPIALKEVIGVLGMKPIASGVLLETKTVTAVECLHYVISLPVSVVITGCESLPILQQALEAARSYLPLTEESCSVLLAKTAKIAIDGKYERYKTETMYDGTSHNPQWLG
jgi:aryl-alcohol dehydrogenase-like predicted oxidoreductase